MVDIVQLVRAPVCGTGNHGFESHYPPHRFILYIGLSPSGKAPDFDSGISLVRIQPAQPKQKICSNYLNRFFYVIGIISDFINRKTSK